MSTGFLWFDPRSKPLSTSGQPQAGCYACFFLTGTTTPANVYADGPLTTPLSQPTPGSVNPSAGTVADGNGRLPAIYLNPNVVYRVQLYSASGVMLEDTDPFFVPGSPNVTFGDGTAAAPGIAFTNHTSTGLYVPGANMLGFATDGIAAGAIDANQAWSIPAASGENTLTVTGNAGFYAESLIGSASSGNSFGLEISAGTTSADTALLVQNQAAGATFLQINGDGSGQLGPNSTNKLSWDTNGAFTIAAPAAGTGLVVNGLANSNAVLINGSTTSGQGYGLRVQGGSTSADWCARFLNQASSADFLLVQGDGQVYIKEPPAASTGNFTGVGHQVGYIDTPQRSISASSSIGFTDRGKQIFLSGGSGQTLTIPANGSVALPIGTTVLVVNQSANNWSIAITTDTLTLFPAGSTGTRTLATNGIATLLKTGATSWVCFGTNLS